MQGPDRPSSAELRHEPNTANVRSVWLTAALLVLLLAMSSVAAAYLLGWYRAARPGVPVRTLVPETAEPVRHWANPPGDLAELRRLQRERLSGYGWINRERGEVRIPIERAMALTSERGWSAPREAVANQAAKEGEP